MATNIFNPKKMAISFLQSSDVVGEATAAYLTRMLRTMAVPVSRLASGLPVGADLEYADEVTLGRAFEGRRRVED